MRRSLWIILGVGIGLLALYGCKKAATPSSVVPSTTTQPTHRIAQGAGQATPPSRTSSGQTSAAVQPVNPAQSVGSDPGDGRQAPFATWWNRLTPEEREKFNKLSPAERQKKMQEILEKK